jgi:hypothetical protein
MKGIGLLCGPREKTSKFIMKFNDVRTYKIRIQGRVADEDIRATSPLPFTIEQVEGTNTSITLRADQSGIIGLIRHLHGLGLVLISISCDMGKLTDHASIPSSDE